MAPAEIRFPTRNVAKNGKIKTPGGTETFSTEKIQ